jgi:hypothetical protein
MEQLSYSKLQNNHEFKTGGGLMDMISGAAGAAGVDVPGTSSTSMLTDNIPIIFALLATCTLSSYMCSNSNKIFKKSTEEYFLYMWIGIILIGGVLGALQKNNFLIALPPFVGPGIYFSLMIALILSCCYSM